MDAHRDVRQDAMSLHGTEETEGAFESYPSHPSHLSRLGAARPLRFFPRFHQ
jgi:hypothetical protein